jgi:seryl-tRNA synthetase
MKMTNESEEEKPIDMEFKLKAALKCSGSLSGEMDPSEIEKFVTSCNTDLLRRGAPPGCGAEIVKWNVAKDKIELKIVSDRFVRAHDALLRVKKELGKLLGKHRIGIRGIEIEKYKIALEWKAEGELKIHKLPFVKEIKQEKERLELLLDVDESALDKRIPDRLIRLVEDKRDAARWKGKSEHWELLFESDKKPFLFDKDPTEEMLQRDWIQHAAGRGQYIYGPQLTRIFRALEKILLDEILMPLGYKEMIFPKFVAWDVWKRSGHAKGIYPEAYYVCTPKTRDPEYWEDVMDYFKVTNEVPVDMIMGKIENVGGMCYAQCPPFWVFLQGKILANETLPITVFDRSGTSYRYESGGLHGIERLDEFHRVEIVWIGNKQQTIAHSKELREMYRHIFNDILDIEWREAWVTPWFMAQEGKAGLAELKEVGTVDYEAVLPYSDKWLEFQNVSVNGDKYPKGFSVKLQSGEELWSGCSGVGLERWAAVFLAQKGLDTENWPEKFKTIVGELPEVFKFL